MTQTAPRKHQFETLIQLMTALPDEQAAIDHFTALRWKNGAFCPHCGSTKVYHFSDRRNHKCGDCRKRFSIKVGTIFEDSKIELRTWMLAVWMLTSHKKGIASTTLARDLGVTQKTAWFMLHRLRHAAQTKSFNRPLEGEVEIDETYVGGKGKNRHKSDLRHRHGTADKTAVIGALERGGQAVATVIGFWALLKRQIIGIHHVVTPKHLHAYVGEVTWRFNLRGIGEGDRVNALLDQTSGGGPSKELIA